MKKTHKGSPLTGTSTPPLTAGISLFPSLWSLPGHCLLLGHWTSLGISEARLLWHLPEFLGGIKCQAYPVSQRQTKVKLYLKVQMADCAQDANRRCKPWHSKARTHHLLGCEVVRSVLAPRTTECVPANTFAD